MPVANESTAAAASRSRVARLTGLAGMLLAGFVAFACLVLLVVRYLVLPRVDAYRPEIAERLSRELGAPVTIEALTTGWDGWNPVLVVTGLAIRDRAGAVEKPLLELPGVSATVSWWSLPLLDLRLKELELDRPRLALTRAADGRIHVAGIEIDPAAARDDTRLTDWLLRQREIVVRDGLILWNDELRRAPQLVLDRVQFKLEHPLGSRRHRFGLTGEPPPEIASPIDLRGEFIGANVNDWSTMRARMYLRLDYADLAAWSEWIPLPFEVDDGRGALRLWAEFSDGKVRDMTGDVVLADVRTRLAASLPKLELAHLDGRVTWQSDNATRRFTTRGLVLVARDGTTIAPSDVAFEGVVGDDGHFRSGRVSAEVLELAPLASLAARLPLPAAVLEDLARYAPRGTVRNARYRWEGPVDAPTSYTAEGEAIDLGIAPSDKTPGIAGLNAKFRADERGGSATLGSRSTILALPQVFAAPIVLDSLTGAVRWRREEAPAEATNFVEWDDLVFASANASGRASGSWRSAKTSPGLIEMKAQLGRFDVRGLANYLPVTLDKSVRDWLRLGITAGTAEDVRVTLKGDLAQFPYADPKRGTFLLAAKARGVTLNYADAWPAIAEIDADVRFEGSKLVVDGTRGRVFGAQIGRTRVEIDNIAANVPRLSVDGEASGPTAEFLRFVASSPVAGWTGHALDNAQATGNGRLKLRFDIPLGEAEGRSVAGEYAFAANQIRSPGVPTLSQVDGRILFTERGMSSNDLTAEVFGGPAKLAIASVEGGMRVTGQGAANMAALAADLPDMLAGRLSGTTDWTLLLDARTNSKQWTVESTLRGVAIDLPAPVGKLAGEAAPLRIERKPDAKGTTDSLVVDLARVGKVLLHRQLAGNEPVVDRALVLLGRAATQGHENDRPGIWVRGDIASLNLDDWFALRARMQGRAGSAPAPGALAMRGIDLDAAVLETFGRKLNEVKASARAAGEDWRVQFTSREAAGTASWRAATPAWPNGRVMARLSRLSVPEAGELTPWSSGQESGSTPRTDANTNPWPELDVQSDALLTKGRDLGRFEMIARPQASDWRIEKMVLASDAGRLQADGWWRITGRTQHTRLDVSLEAADAGAMLKRFGFPDDVKAAPTTITGELDWAGAPSDFDSASLSGSLKVDVGAGQFTKIEPGLGKLLGVLSLQALPRRIALDFRDVFSEGFAFDRIEGSVRIARGVMTTTDFKLNGPAAKVDITGEADLTKETQTLNVRVQPALSSMLGAGTAGAALLLLAANPIVAAAVGAGAMLAQKVMKDPFEQMFSYDYRVTGPWTDPVVVRIDTRGSGQAAALQASPAGPEGSATKGAAPASTTGAAN